MKVSLFVILFALLIGSCNQTKEMSTRSFPDRYTVELPKGWHSKKKLMSALTSILPATFTELKDLQFCHKCDAGYVVKLVITDPITDQILLRQNEDFAPVSMDVRLFSFGANFVVYKNDKPIVYMRIIRELEDIFAHNAPKPLYAPPVSDIHFSNIPMSQLSLSMDPRSYSEKSYRSEPKRKSAGKADEKDALNLVEQRLLELHKRINSLELVNEN